MADDYHQFLPFGNEEIKSCARCGFPRTHEVHGPPILDVAKPIEETRIDRHEMFLEISGILRKRSTCNRGKVGCVIVQDRRIVSTGYNGSPAGTPHCFELGCEPHINEHVEGCFRTVHAEANCIAFAAKHGVSTNGGTMYSTHSPCHECAKLLVSAGIVEFYYTTSYRAERLDVLKESGVKIVLAR